MNSPINLDPVIKKVDGQATAIPGEEVIVTIDATSGKAVEKTFFMRVAGSFQDYLVANNKNPLRSAGGKLPPDYLHDARGERTLAIEIGLEEVSCPERQERKVAEALHGIQTPGVALTNLLQRWVREFVPPGDEGKFIDNFTFAKEQLVNHLVARAQSQTGLKVKPTVSLSKERKVPQEIVVGPIEIGVRLHQDTEEQKLTVEAGLELDPQNYVKAFVFKEGQQSPEELFKRHLKDYFFHHVTFDQFTRDLQYVHFRQPIIEALSQSMKQVGRRVKFLNLSTGSDGPVKTQPELIIVTYNFQHLIHGRAHPVTIQNTVQLDSQDSGAYKAAGKPDLNAWVKANLDVVLPRHLIGKTYVDLLLRFEQSVEKIKREMGDRARSIGYRVDHLVSLPYLPELDLIKPFILEAEDTFETKLDGFEVQLKFTIKMRIPKLESVEKYINPGTDVKEAIKQTVLAEARQCLRVIPPERFYLFFNHPNEAASALDGDDRLPVKDLLDNKIRESLRREFKPEISDLTFRVGRTDLSERHRNLCHVIRPFRIHIESPDPHATEDLTLTGDFVLHGVYPDTACWRRFSVLRLDLDGLQTQLETHLKAELKTFYQAGFMFQNRMTRNQVFSTLRNYAAIYMRDEFGLIIHITNLDRNTTLAEENQRRLLIDLENNKLAALVEQSEHIVERLKELRRERVRVLSIAPPDKETLKEIDESIRALDEELRSISSARFRQHHLAATLETQLPDLLPPANGEEQVSSALKLESGVKGQLTGQ